MRVKQERFICSAFSHELDVRVVCARAVRPHRGTQYSARSNTRQSQCRKCSRPLPARRPFNFRALHQVVEFSPSSRSYVPCASTFCITWRPSVYDVFGVAEFATLTIVWRSDTPRHAHAIIIVSYSHDTSREHKSTHTIRYLGNGRSF